MKNPTYVRLCQKEKFKIRGAINTSYYSISGYRGTKSYSQVVGGVPTWGRVYIATIICLYWHVVANYYHPVLIYTSPSFLCIPLFWHCIFHLPSPWEVNPHFLPTLHWRPKSWHPLLPCSDIYYCPLCVILRNHILAPSDIILKQTQSCCLKILSKG